MSDTATGVSLVGTCQTCNQARYKSKFPFTKPEDAKSDNFEPIGDAPVPRGDAPPVCHVCESMLTFGRAPEAPTDTPGPRLRAVQSSTKSEASAPRLRINTVFQTQDGEAILEVRGTFVITNKRIVELA